MGEFELFQPGECLVLDVRSTSIYDKIVGQTASDSSWFPEPKWFTKTAKRYAIGVYVSRLDYRIRLKDYIAVVVLNGSLDDIVKKSLIFDADYWYERLYENDIVIDISRSRQQIGILNKNVYDTIVENPIIDYEAWCHRHSEDVRSAALAFQAEQEEKKKAWEASQGKKK